MSAMSAGVPLPSDPTANLSPDAGSVVPVTQRQDRVLASAPPQVDEHVPWGERHPWLFRLDGVVGKIGQLLWEPPSFVAIDPYALPDAGWFLELDSVMKLETRLPARFRLIPGLLRLAGMGWSELAGLRRRACQPDRCRIHIEADGDNRFGQELQLRALRCRPTYVVEPAIALDLRKHLEEFTARGSRALVFTSEAGQALRRDWFLPEVWVPALKSAGLPETADPVDLVAAWMIEEGGGGGRGSGLSRSLP